MRLLMDLFPCQTGSRFRGIGRYTLSLAQALSCKTRGHDFYIAANGLYPDSIETIRQTFLDKLSPGHLSFYSQPLRKNFTDPHIFEVVSSAVIHRAYQSISPDVTLYTSPFEGWQENGVVALPNGPLPGGVRVAVIYDFIPWLFPKYHFTPIWGYEDWYTKRLGALKKFDLLLAISEATRRDAIEIIGMSPERVVNISGAAESFFAHKKFSEEESQNVSARFGIFRPFVLYTGNVDHNKNLNGMLKAYSQLPKEVRQRHQLVLMQVGDENLLRKRIRELSLSDDEVVITGRIKDTDLLALYNLCKVFVFPSLYEGFGLPLIEAMTCGAPVIAANNSSLPEVMGREDMLFDANNAESISSSLYRVLSNDKLRQDLSDYGIKRSREFSWEKTANSVWEAIESVVANQGGAQIKAVVGAFPKSRIAFVSPLPPQKSGIADYSNELLPHLARHFEIDLFVETGVDVTSSFLCNNFAIYPYSDLISKMHLYQSVVYQFGNSPFHTHMLALLAECPGVVVLHDFFLSNLPYDKEFLKGETGAFAREIADVHGLKGAVDYALFGHEVARQNWPINGKVLARAQSIIVHSSFHQKLLKRFYGKTWRPYVHVVPQIRKLPPVRTSNDCFQTRASLGVLAEEFLILCSGIVAPTKLAHVAIEAFALARKELGSHARLVFVGEMDSGSYGQKLRQLMLDLEIGEDIFFAGYSTTKVYRDYLVAANVAIQLRADSRGETSRAVLDCLAHGLPLIINAHGTFDDYDSQTVIKLSDPPKVREVADALIRLAQDDALRCEIVSRGRDLIKSKHHPVRIAEAYAAVIHSGWSHNEKRVLENIADALASTTITSELKNDIVETASENSALRLPSRLLIDVTRIADNDPCTGIERVIKNIIREFVAIDRPELHILLVRLHEGKLWQANRLAETIFELSANALGLDAVVDPRHGDTLFMFDSSWFQIDHFSPVFSQVRRLGGIIITVVYDLIPIRYPKLCHQFVLDAFEPWLKRAISESDHLVCISQSVADDLLNYIETNKALVCRRLSVSYWHLGANLTCLPNGEMKNNNMVKWLKNKSDSPATFLMVGTIEPRKGYDFVLNVFEDLWKQDSNVRLCIIGKEGWHVDLIMHRIRTHPEAGKHFFFTDDASDAELNMAYQSATALISASASEGFGLPIIEAAIHGKPAILSDIPVFREVGGVSSAYFSLQHPQTLADIIVLFCDLSEDERTAMASRIKVNTWKESATRLLDIINGVDVYTRLSSAKHKTFA